MLRDGNCGSGGHQNRASNALVVLVLLRSWRLKVEGVLTCRLLGRCTGGLLRKVRCRNQLHVLVTVPGFQVGHGVLQVLAELVLEEHLMKLLELAQLQHRFQLGHARGRAVVRLLLRLRRGLGWLVSSVWHSR